MTTPSRAQRATEALHHGLVAPFYGGLSSAYDCAAWLISGGLWRRWTFAAEGFVAGEPVLEVGCGRGHLLARLAGRALEVIGLDLSPRMATAARNRLRRARLPGCVVRADARRMPFPDASIGTLINTFPDRYVKDRATWTEYARVLRPGDRWVVVEKPLVERFHPRLVGVCLATVARFGSLAPLRSVGETGVPMELFPRQYKQLVPVGPTRVVVAIFERAD